MKFLILILIIQVYFHSNQMKVECLNLFIDPPDLINDIFEPQLTSLSESLASMFSDDLMTILQNFSCSKYDGFCSGTNGVCFDNKTVVWGFECRCKSGFSGLLCEIDEKNSVCAKNSTNPCLNGGRCVTLQTGYMCECKKEYSGPECQVKCSSTPKDVYCK
jgi:hypothetical protein